MESIKVFMHEIKNPLSNIYAIAQLIENEDSIDEIKNCMELVKKSIIQVKEIEADFSQYQSTGKLPVSKRTINVADALSSIVTEYTQNGKSNNILIKTNIRTARAYTDLGKFNQVFSNLISNAIKYSKVGNDTGREILIDCRSTGSGARISILDNGIGMSQDELKLLGTEFYRCKRIDVNGTGLGFSLVKKMVKILGWELTVSSKLGKATEVVVFVK